MVSVMSCVTRSASSQRMSPKCSLKVRRMLESGPAPTPGGGRRPRWAPGRSRRIRPAAGSSASPASRSGSCPGRWRPGRPWTGPPPACRIRCKRATDPILRGQPSGNKKPPVRWRKANLGLVPATSTRTSCCGWPTVAGCSITRTSSSPANAAPVRASWPPRWAIRRVCAGSGSATMRPRGCSGELRSAKADGSYVRELEKTKSRHG